MSQLFYLAPLLLLLSSLLGSSMAATPVSLAATFTAPQLTVAVSTSAVAAGATQTLQIHLAQSAERTASLILVVTYPNGVTERSLHSVRGSAATLSWRVPSDARPGLASFSLAAVGCGCDQKGTVPPPTKLESDVAGTFQVTGGS